jgi:Na+-translocating ferredoxin:NAD+ oxidoreductase RnfA subunit
MLSTGIQGRPRTQFIGMVFVQIFFTSFFVLQWLGVCMFYWITLVDAKSADDLAITYFVMSLSNNLYYVINIKSFYLSTLTSRVFRETFKTGLLKLIH